MRLPQVSYADGIKTAKQDEFAGLNHNLGAKDGELWDMRNLVQRLLSPAGDQVAADAVQDAAGPRRSVLLGQAVLGGRDHVLL